jgi:HPt (histidine-containing phosphotransfer) domain-containing protein
MSKTEQPVDLQHLDRYTGGDRAINEEILRLFDAQCREMLATLDSLAAGEHDAKSWRATLHTLKGAARAIGAFALGDAAAAAEQAASERDVALVALTPLKASFAAVHRFIEDFLSRRAFIGAETR